MKHLLLGLLTLTSFSIVAQQTNETIVIGGVTRAYTQYLPSGFNSATESLPVVFILHGLGDNATNMAGIGTNNIADTARFIAIYPQGTLNAFNSTGWNNGTLLASPSDDIGLMNALMDDMILNYNANPARIFVTGFSMGGIMAHHLACEMNDRIAAIASMSGTMATSDISGCVPTYKTPVMHLHGTADGTVPYSGAPLPSLSLVDQTMQFWRDVHTCASTADSTQLPNTANDGITVDKFVWDGCTPNESVELWRMNNADHVYMYQPVNDFTESKEIWRFFYRWSHPNPATAGTAEIQGNFNVHVFPNPASEILTITTAKELEVSLIDVNGKVCASSLLVPGENTMDISTLDAGVYVVLATNGFSQKIVVQ